MKTSNTFSYLITGDKNYNEIKPSITGFIY